MISPSDALSNIPAALRAELLEEYNLIVTHFMEHKWGPSEVNAGRFCEVVYTILEAYPSGKYPHKAGKPANFVNACRSLENATGVTRSFQVLIPRMLPPLYEIRNNRDAGHVGAEVDSNHMDAGVALGMANWIMAELIRVFHRTTIEEAQVLVDSIAERRVSLVWQSGPKKRVLDPSIELRDQALILIGTHPGLVKIELLMKWLDKSHRGNFLKIIKKLHDKRNIEYDKEEDTVEILPPGMQEVEQLIAKLKH